MPTNKEITNKELESGAMTGENDVIESGETIKSIPSSFEEQTHHATDNRIRESGTSGHAASPLETSQRKYFESQKKYYDSRAAFWQAFKTLIGILSPIAVGLLAILGGIWAYKLNNIAEPIGGMKVEIEYLKEDEKDVKLKLEKIDEMLNQINLLQQKQVSK